MENNAPANNAAINPISLSANISPQQQVPKPVPAVNSNNVDVKCLQTILKEIAALQSENARAMAVISSLQADKQLLMSKTMELCEEVKELRKFQTDNVSSVLEQLTTEVKALRATVLVCDCYENKTKNVKLNAKKQDHLPPVTATCINLPVVSVPPGETNSPVSPSHSYAAVSAAPLSTGAYSAAVTNTATVKLTAIDTAAATTPAVPSSSTNKKMPAKSTSFAPTSNSVPLKLPAQIAMTDVTNGPNSSTAIRTQEWNTVSRASRKKMKKPLVIGSNHNNELSVVPNMKWLHLSSFSNTVTAADIVDYIVKYAAIDQKSLTCHMLVKKDTPVKDCKKINFKLGVSECYYDKLLNADIWPTNVRIRPFTFFQKVVAPPQLP